MNDQDKLIKLSIDKFVRTEASNRKVKRDPHKLAKEYGPLLDNFNDVIFITDKAGRFLFVNKVSEQRTGIPADILIGRHFLEIINPEYHEIAQEIYQKALSGAEEIPAIEMEWETASGKKVTTEINWKVLSGDSLVDGFLAVSRDISDRKHAQEALKKARDELEMRVRERTADLQKANKLLEKQIEERIQAEEKYRGLFENSGDAIFIVEIETGIIRDANRQAEKLTGRPKRALIGLHQSQLYPTVDSEYYQKKFQKHIKHDLVFDLEAEVVKKDGSVVPVFICSNVIDLQGKKVIQGIFRDISKEKIISDLKGELASRKLIRKAKAIIAKHYKINDSDAMKLLQRESRRQNRKLKEIAQAVISSKFILD